MRGPGMTPEVAVRADLDSGALIVSVQPDHTDEQVRAAVDASAEQHPGAIVLDLTPAPGRWSGPLRGLARVCLRHAVPLVVVPVLVAPTQAPVRSLASPLPVNLRPSVAEALASLPSATVPTAHQRRLELPPDPQAAAQARSAVASTLRLWGLEHLAFPVQLITSELVTNAVRHAGTPVGLLLRLGRGGVRVAVHDGDPTLPEVVEGPGDLDREGGRGLFLVAATAQRWGCLSGTHDKIVWAEVAPDQSRVSRRPGRVAP